MRVIILSSSLALLLACQVSSYHVLTVPQKLHVSVFTTSKCRDTINFVTNQLYPTYQRLKDYLEVQIIPWGKSKRVEDGSVRCQFGEDDCIANRIQSCVLHILGGFQDKTVEYINCEFRTLAATTGNLHCANQVGVSDFSVSQCIQSILVDQLERDAELKTTSIGLSFVPTIVFNGVFDQATQDAAFKNFEGSVCGILERQYPGICAQHQQQGDQYGYNDVIQ